VVTNAANAIVWRWDSDPFGAAAPDEDPDGDANRFEFNLRFPGQYYDRETNLHYNYFRDYDPQTGRYVQSDPIGLRGGINTYSYVGGNPLSYTDPLGLNPTAGAGAAVGGMVGGPVGAVVGGVIGFGAGLAIGNWIFNQPEVDPVPAQQPFNPGRDCNGKCNPCPPPIYWDAPGNKHGSSSGTHAHGIVWNQDPSTCMCYPRRVSGPSFGNTR
jgi:RHS repeat-associated protein